MPANRVNVPIQIGDLGGGDLQPITRQIFCEHDPVAVIDQAARRRHWHQLDSIFLGESAEVVVAEDL
jgi:hypothetical protein